MTGSSCFAAVPRSQLRSNCRANSPYSQVVAHHGAGLSEAQAASRAFEVASRLRERLSRLLIQDGAPSAEVSTELRNLMESIRP